jgi:hypothetical protein
MRDLEDGESGLLIGFFDLVEDDELPCEVVESGSQVMDGIPDGDGPSIEIRQRVEVAVHDYLSSGLVNLMPDVYGFKRDPGFNLGVKLMSMFVGPFQFGGDTV